MTLQEAVQKRHSVRSYQDKPLSQEVLADLQQLIVVCNTEGNLHLQLVRDEPRAFGGIMAHYGKFSGVSNYLAMVGEKTPDLQEKCGYYGERIVLAVQTWGLNTCWVALTYKKINAAFELRAKEKMEMVIALGYGSKPGIAHPIKPLYKLGNYTEKSPAWFYQGLQAAALAPTAMNQQKFYFSQQDKIVFAKAGMGFYTKTDLGIAKYHFELGAGKENFTWG